MFHYFGSTYPKFFRMWFTFGVYFGILSMVCSVVLLIFSLYSMLATPTEQQILTPVVCWNFMKNNFNLLIEFFFFLFS